MAADRSCHTNGLPGRDGASGPVRAVTFDIGNTLLFVEPSVGAVYAEVAAEHGIEISPEQAGERFFAAWAEIRANHEGLVYGRSHDEAQAFWLRVVAKVFAERIEDPRDLTPFMLDLYWRFSRPEVWRVHPSWERVTSQCRRCGVRIGYVSNWDKRLRGLLDGLGLLEHADTVVISAECGWEKPHPGIFHHAASQLGGAPDSVVHVGDTWQDDVLGPRQIGMRSVWFNPDGEPPPDPDAEVRMVSDLGEVPELLGLGEY